MILENDPANGNHLRIATRVDHLMRLFHIPRSAGGLIPALSDGTEDSPREPMLSNAQLRSTSL